MEGVRWSVTDSLDVAGLHHQYVTKRTTHAFQLCRLLEAIPAAIAALRSADHIVVVGPGFGEEVDIIEDAIAGRVSQNRQAMISAVEINKAAWGPLGFERPYLEIRQHMNDVPAIKGSVVFVAVHVLRQPSLASDCAMAAFADQLLRIAPDGATALSTLPHCYYVYDTRFAPPPITPFSRSGVDADCLLVHHLEGKRTVSISVESSDRPQSSRLAMISIGAASETL
jgi:hypothetical protein